MYHGMMYNFVQYKNDKWASAKCEFNTPRICFSVPPNMRKIVSREINSVYSTLMKNAKKVVQEFINVCIVIPKPSLK